MGGRCSLSSATAVDNKWILIVKPPEEWDKSEPLLGDLCTVREQYVIRISSCKNFLHFTRVQEEAARKKKAAATPAEAPKVYRSGVGKYIKQKPASRYDRIYPFNSFFSEN